MKNPYEPPKYEKSKYKEPMVDWGGLCIVVSAMIIPIFIYLFVVGVLAQ